MIHRPRILTLPGATMQPDRSHPDAPLRGTVGVQNVQYDAKQQNVRSYSTNQWLRLDLVVDAVSRTYALKVDGVAVLADGAFLESADSVERIVFRTGEFRLRDFTRRPQVDGTWLTDRIPNADVMQPTTMYDLDHVFL